MSGRYASAMDAGGAATTALRAELPTGVVSANPMPKAGWTVQIDREALATPCPDKAAACSTTE